MRIATSVSLILRSQLRLPIAKPISCGTVARQLLRDGAAAGDLPRVTTSRISASTMREMLKPECSKKAASSAARIACAGSAGCRCSE
jgi:hypothetical protein